jgi:hypothetical protein
LDVCLGLKTDVEALHGGFERLLWRWEMSGRGVEEKKIVWLTGYRWLGTFGGQVSRSSVPFLDIRLGMPHLLYYSSHKTSVLVGCSICHRHVVLGNGGMLVNLHLWYELSTLGVFP